MVRVAVLLMMWRLGGGVLSWSGGGGGLSFL